MQPALSFIPSRSAGLARQTEFLPMAGHYGSQRNYVRPEHKDVARLSPWLQKRLLLESEVVDTVLAKWPWSKVEKFVQEVYWRTYWKGWLEQRPAAWDRWVAAVPRLRDALSGERRNAWEAACSGRTGIAGFDEWAKELVTTGYLHNHARMWFASIWIFTLRLPWELGAAFFYEHLLDGDVASNTLSWRWVAGLQTPGKTYLARADNITFYTEGRCAPGASQLATSPFAITEEPLPKVVAWTDPITSANPQTRATTSERVGLWIHAEDLSAERGELAQEKFASINAAWPTRLAQRAGWSVKVEAWTRAAQEEGAARAAKHFGATVINDATDNLAENLVTWSKEHNLNRIIAYRPFVGPWLEEAMRAEQALRSNGVEVTWRRRRWDAEHFPHATRGYFPFWENVKQKLSNG